MHTCALEGRQHRLDSTEALCTRVHHCIDNFTSISHNVKSALDLRYGPVGMPPLDVSCRSRPPLNGVAITRPFKAFAIHPVALRLPPIRDARRRARRNAMPTRTRGIPSSSSRSVACMGRLSGSRIGPRMPSARRQNGHRPKALPQSGALGLHVLSCAEGIEQCGRQRTRSDSDVPICPRGRPGCTGRCP